jgi:ferrous iron transport protein A
MHHELLPLEMLPAGESALVAELYGEPAWVGRMAELGIRIGSRLRMLQSGSPCLLEVGSSRFSLRSDATIRILVRPEPA